ncbi:hypothetical protein HanIR_Chr12g0606021 [Helianthus annuus]|nr:hypothetical protein HanIR_Chr12g0606021 [Helianthus annuus]
MEVTKQPLSLVYFRIIKNVTLAKLFMSKQVNLFCQFKNKTVRLSLLGLL